MRMPSMLMALAGLAGAAPAHAQLFGAQVCYSAEQPFGSAILPTNATVFTCPVGGDATVPQLAASSWRIVKLAPVVASATTTRVQLVIRRHDLVFRSGFEAP